MRLHTIVCLIGILSVVLSSCSSNISASPTATFTPIAKPTSTIFPSPSPLPSSTYAPTKTHTPPPSSTYTPTITHTPSPSPTATITPTPLPTIARNKGAAKLEQLYGNNNGCRLPCWWGIIPGVTTWGETLHFLNQFSEFSGIEKDSQFSLTENPGKFTHYTLRLPSPYPQVFYYATRVDFEEQSGIVVAIRLWDDIGSHMFSPNKLHSEYGNPDRVFVVPEGCNHNLCSTHMYFIYDSQRFMSLDLLESFPKENDTEINLCISNYTWLSITTWADSVNIDIDSRETRNPKFLPFEQVTNLTIDEFLTQLSKKGESCITAPLSLWK
jgi:hypothetical protein